MKISNAILRGGLSIQVKNYLSVVFIVTFLLFGLWSLCLPKDDCKGPRYIFWKLGLYPMYPNIVFSGMACDRNSEEIVIGKTKSELEKLFGELKTCKDGNEYQKDYCNKDLKENSENILWLGNSHWSVILKNGKVIKLILNKG